jgi:phosphate butyryltransferase
MGVLAPPAPPLAAEPPPTDLTGRAISSFEDVVAAVREYPLRTVAVAAADDRTVIESLKQALALDVARPLLVGSRRGIMEKAEAVGLTLAESDVIDSPDPAQAARQAAQAVREGRADILMKGYVHTDDFLRGVLDKERGLRTGHLMSHAFVLELVKEDRVVLVTDGAMNIQPTLDQKAQIILNAIYLAQMLGIEEPRVAVLSAVELVTPAMQSTVDASVLAKMGERRQFSRGIVDGPFALDNAVSMWAAEHKKIGGPVAGRADVLVVPNIEAGNMLVK